MLDKKKTRLLEALIKGESLTDLAKELEVNRTTLYLWMKLPEFIAEREKLQKELLDDLYNISLLEVKESLITTTNDYYKLQVLQSLLKVKHADKLEVTNKSVTLEDLLQDI